MSLFFISHGWIPSGQIPYVISSLPGTILQVPWSSLCRRGNRLNEIKLSVQWRTGIQTQFHLALTFHSTVTLSRLGVFSWSLKQSLRHGRYKYFFPYCWLYSCLPAFLLSLNTKSLFNFYSGQPWEGRTETSAISMSLFIVLRFFLMHVATSSFKTLHKPQTRPRKPLVPPELNVTSWWINSCAGPKEEPLPWSHRIGLL